MSRASWRLAIAELPELRFVDWRGCIGSNNNDPGKWSMGERQVVDGEMTEGGWEEREGVMEELDVQATDDDAGGSLSGWLEMR